MSNGVMPEAVETKRRIAKGLVIAGAHKLYWISCNPSAGNSEWALADDTVGGGDIVLEHFHITQDSHNTNLIPPMQFYTGIYHSTANNS